jgi:effector-binding domain-containing protein
MMHWLSRAHEQVRAVLDAYAVPVAGPRFARFVATDERLSVEAGFPVPAAIDDLGDVLAAGLPGGTAVVATHEDPAESLDITYAALDRWLRRHGYLAAGPHWEVYPTDGSGVEVVVPYR